MAKLLGHDIVTTTELDEAKAEIARIQQTHVDLLEDDIESVDARVSKTQTFVIIFGILSMVVSIGALILSLQH